MVPLEALQLDSPLIRKVFQTSAALSRKGRQYLHALVCKKWDVLAQNTQLQCLVVLGYCQF